MAPLGPQKIWVDLSTVSPRASQVMAASPIGSPMLKLRAPLVLDLPQEAWFDVGLMHKDVRLALAMARDLGIQLPSTGVADQILTRAAQLGYEHGTSPPYSRSWPAPATMRQTRADQAHIARG